MNWINDLLWGEGIGHSILLLSFVIAAGIQLGKIKVFGVSLGNYSCVVCGDHFRTFRFYDQPQRDSSFLKSSD